MGHYDKLHYILYAAITALFIYAVYKERQALGCQVLPFEGKDCDNANGKTVVGTESYPSDSRDVIAEKISFAADYHNRMVVWRAAIILGFIGTILVCLITTKRFPSPIHLIVGTLVYGILYYFTQNFYNYHLVSYIKANIDTSVKLLLQK